MHIQDESILMNEPCFVLDRQAESDFLRASSPLRRSVENVQINNIIALVNPDLSSRQVLPSRLEICAYVT